MFSNAAHCDESNFPLLSTSTHNHNLQTSDRHVLVQKINSYRIQVRSKLARYLSQYHKTTTNNFRSISNLMACTSTRPSKMEVYHRGFWEHKWLQTATWNDLNK